MNIQLRGCQLVEYLLLEKLSDDVGDDATRVMSSHQRQLALCTTETAGRCLAQELWSSLQVAVMVAITNMDALETAVRQGLTRTMTLPTPPILQVMTESSLAFES